MSALEKLISLADGTTDESMHVCVPVSLIRELQAWMPGERERLTANGVKAWAGVDAQDLRDEPEHVQRAAMDEDIRQAAIDWAGSSMLWRTVGVTKVGKPRRYHTEALWPSETPSNRTRVDRAIRILRHFGLLVEHGDGVVSIKERS